jgi:hypothetical protein
MQLGRNGRNEWRGRRNISVILAQTLAALTILLLLLHLLNSPSLVHPELLRLSGPTLLKWDPVLQNRSMLSTGCEPECTLFFILHTCRHHYRHPLQELVGSLVMPQTTVVELYT